MDYDWASGGFGGDCMDRNFVERAGRHPGKGGADFALRVEFAASKPVSSGKLHLKRLNAKTQGKRSLVERRQTGLLTLLREKNG